MNLIKTLSSFSNALFSFYKFSKTFGVTGPNRKGKEHTSMSENRPG